MIASAPASIAAAASPAACTVDSALTAARMRVLGSGGAGDGDDIGLLAAGHEDAFAGMAVQQQAVQPRRGQHIGKMPGLRVRIDPPRGICIGLIVAA
jgi:hypothetical protein